MKKKTLALVGASALAVLTLTACPAKPANKTTQTNTGTATGGTTTGGTTTGSTTTTKLQIAVNYKGEQGISARETYQNTVENVNYREGQILPV